MTVCMTRLVRRAEQPVLMRSLLEWCMVLQSCAETRVGRGAMLRALQDMSLSGMAMLQLAAATCGGMRTVTGPCTPQVLGAGCPVQAARPARPCRRVARMGL